MKTPAGRYQWALFILLSALSGFSIYAHRAMDGRAEVRPARIGAESAAVHSSSRKTEPVVESFEPAQAGGSFNITQSVVPGGGGASSGGNLSINDSIGQPVVGVSSGGNFSLNDGFWSEASDSGCPAIIINPASLPNGGLGQSYSQQLSQTGGVAPINWSLSAGSLPNNVTLNSSTGLLSGTPTASGTFNFTVKVTDASNCMATQPYSVFIGNCPTITLTPATLPVGMLLSFYNQQLTASGGAPPYAFTISAGALPTGLTLTANGLLSGTPTVAGSFNFTVRATDFNACVVERGYGLTIAANPGLQFYPLTSPVRLLDTRFGTSPNACSQPNLPIAAGTSRNQPARNFCGLPANAAAITGNVTTVQSGGGYLTLYPSDAVQPTVASTNYGVNEIINNVFTVGLGNADGAFNIFALSATDVVVDVTGYYAPPGIGGLYFHPLPAPVRLLETRVGLPVGCVKPGVPLIGGLDSLQTATTACTGIPATARAVVGNATTVSPQAPGYLTIFPADAARPLVASSNYNAGQVVNGPFTTGLSAAGQFKVFTTATTDLVIDLLGYYSADAVDANGQGLLFTPLTHPVRLLETRAGLPVGCYRPGAPLNGNQVYLQVARGACDGLTIPINALGVVGNATTVLPVSGGFLTLWPSSATQPTVATANYNSGQVINRHFIVGLGNADGAFKMFSSATTELVIDLSGYFAP